MIFIYGRDDDKKLIFDWISSDTDEKLSILSIVGMGGLGKTTLAQLVYNDPRMESKFDDKAWICVSEEFNVLNISRAILDSLTDSTETSDQLEIVHTKLIDKLRGNKFFLVLDDVWNESQSKWKAVQNVGSLSRHAVRKLLLRCGQNNTACIAAITRRLLQEVVRETCISRW